MVDGVLRGVGRVFITLVLKREVTRIMKSIWYIREQYLIKDKILRDYIVSNA